MSPSLLDKTFIDPMNHNLAGGFKAKTSWSMGFIGERKKTRPKISWKPPPWTCCVVLSPVNKLHLQPLWPIPGRREKVMWHQLFSWRSGMLQIFKFHHFTAGDKKTNALFPIIHSLTQIHHNRSISLDTFLWRFFSWGADGRGILINHTFGLAACLMNYR